MPLPAPIPPADHPVVLEHSFVDVRGVRLHVAQAGSGPPVLLLHGFPQHAGGWRHVLPLLAGEYRLICLDLRGAGRSAAPRRGYDTGSRVADVLAVLDALGLRRVRVVGHDWGAWTSFHLCLRAPQRVSHHLALNMVHPWPRHRRLAPRAWRFWYTAILETPGLGRSVLHRFPGFTGWLLRRGVTDPSVWTDAELAEYATSTAEPARARAGEALHRQFAVRDVAALVAGRYAAARLAVPTVVLGGADDPVIPPAVLTGAGRHADDLTVRVVPGAGHFLPQERPEEVAAAARELFAR